MTALETERLKQQAVLALEALSMMTKAQRDTGKSRGHFTCPQCQVKPFHWSATAQGGFRGCCADQTCLSFSGH